jgi:diguanylate cyclase (GGDEF)-like protein
MHILIAEDDRVSAHVLEASLLAGGHEVTVVRDGGQAWEVMQSGNRPQMAILDWMMPVMDGLEVCRKIRQAGGPYVYILLLTANIHPAQVVVGIDAGADDYIRKPFEPNELHARLRTGARIIELQEKLRIQATNDALTGLLNRGAIMERLSIELERAYREDLFLSIAMVDLDLFKNINDTYGHSAGDMVLRETARKMKAVLRPYDSIGRYGGEEFIILFPQCDISTAAAVADRVRRFISLKPIDVGSIKLSVTASIGLAQAKGSRDGDALIRTADAALFRAKHGGRNRVEFMREDRVKRAIV